MERETLDVDVLFVGAGPASLAGAYHLSRLIQDHNRAAQRAGETALQVSIALIEKGAEIGSHAFSGAVLDPIALQELIPDFLEQGAPLQPVLRDEVSILTERRKFRLPFIPPPLRNHGNHIVSLGRLVRWLADRLERLGGVDLLPGFGGRELLYEGARIIGVRTGDKGIDLKGERKANYEPGIDIHAKVTVLGEGHRGSLVKELTKRLDLDRGRSPQVYSTGVKEVWAVPKEAGLQGLVCHTMGFPLRSETFGGGFIYGLSEDRLAVGLVVGLDYRDPTLDLHYEFQRFKLHPFVASLLKEGKILGYGAKAIPEGGYYAIPRLAVDGGLIVGDAGGLLNAMRLKGIHLAMKSGILAAETLFEALAREDTSARQLGRYEDRLRESYVYRELYRVRNFHQGFQHGLWTGLLNTGLQMATGGRGLVERANFAGGHERMMKIREYFQGEVPALEEVRKTAFDGERTFDKVGDVYFSGTKHEEDQPSHLLVADTDLCRTRCAEEYGNPCQHFCPAKVYEMVEAGDGRGKRLQINASNCVHCKTCDIMDPYQVITWVPPEGGGGPRYVDM
ncbi:MAG TPA: electron transfer flavoprotein-ubiquinone oxidoreductase [Candidatus Polarisedimenticolia bacterium]|nr:electron transfer flavoprotein-ubiquinone oxidoreductase [Candidatus Polarisedimenticolia bacterium]